MRTTSETPAVPGNVILRTMSRPSIRLRSLIKPAVFAACLLPLAWLAWRIAAGGPGALGLGYNPQEYLNRFLGDWALRFLLIALAVTPLRDLTRQAWIMRLRRMLGLFAFLYVCLHLTSYVALDQFFDWSEIGKDIVKRNYITVGMAAFVLLVPLAATSTNGMIRRLGPVRWRRLHQLVYAAGVLGCVHYIMMAKGFRIEPLVYAGVLAALLGWRVWRRVDRRVRNRRAA